MPPATAATRSTTRPGQVVRATDCSGRITRYRYHPLGWLVAETGADGEETRYRYDAAGRPVQLDRPEGWTESLQWNAARPAGEACGR